MGNSKLRKDSDSLESIDDEKIPDFARQYTKIQRQMEFQYKNHMQPNLKEMLIIRGKGRKVGEEES